MSTSYYYPLPAVSMNPWEYDAFQYNYANDDAIPGPSQQNDTVHDPMLYPGIYAPSGIDVMSILSRVAMRPSPVVHLGPVDASCAIVVCDIEQADLPVVYANEACAELTGYTRAEMLGRNCRFMQMPGGQRSKHVEKSALKAMRRALAAIAEVAVEITNFKKSGERFTNVLTLIPICWDTPAPKYYIGFLAEKTA